MNCSNSQSHNTKQIDKKISELVLASQCIHHDVIWVWRIFLEMLFFILTLACAWTWADSESCPEEFQRLSEEHTFCLPPNPSCTIEESGIY
ncbi:hypothetical protein TNCT_579591 [Trichonephila clavata]|uniref:Uncharacterized protein n=1 Tax=Trichonephila clavata TaxID=2740835 RepID=A0A8X6GIY6_TRICU|nr:hypothetical protein TNCT_579591 [Trichonephila clavata]